MQIYLDNIATTKVDPIALEAMIPYFENIFGNASSIHKQGIKSAEAIEKARYIIAKKINAEPEEIIFTSGGTESNNQVFSSLLNNLSNGKNHIIISNIEHPSVFDVAKYYESKGVKVTYIPVDNKGLINPDDVKKAITNETVFVSIMQVNNEIGTIQPIHEIGKICKEHNVLFHSDVCQGYTKIEVDVKKDNIDFATLNAHKVHGPKGVGALYINKNTKIAPLLIGGGQENNLRPGTYNTPGIVGFGKAIEVSSFADSDRMTSLRDYFIDRIFNSIDDVILNGANGVNRICNNINIIFKQVDGKKIFVELNKRDIMISTGSACSSTELKPSRIIKALGLDDNTANGSLRIGLSKWTTKEELDILADNLIEIVKTERSKILTDGQCKC